MVPNALLKLADNYKRAIVVDLPRARLYVLPNEHGKLTVERHHYAAMGRNGSRKQTAGDLRAVGLYPSRTGSATVSCRSCTAPARCRSIIERLGPAAEPHRLWHLAAWGAARHVLARARSSEGCVTMANADLDVLRGDVEYGMTPVVLSDEIEWVPAAAVEVVRDSLLRRIED